MEEKGLSCIWGHFPQGRRWRIGEIRSSGASEPLGRFKQRSIKDNPRRGLGAVDTRRWKVLPFPSFEPFCISDAEINAWHCPLKTFLKPFTFLYSVLLFLQTN